MHGQYNIKILGRFKLVYSPWGASNLLRFYSFINSKYNTQTAVTFVGHVTPTTNSSFQNTQKKTHLAYRTERNSTEN